MPTQQTAQTTSFLENLGGIQPQRDITPREKSSLDWLLETEKYAVGEYSKKKIPLLDKTDEVYIKLHKDLSEKLKNVNYNKQDLEMLIHAKANNDYKDKQSQALGLYTGVLLHMLTERNQKEGKKTRFHINGRGNRFDYLFHFAKQVDELIVENFTGNDICSYVGSYKGNAKTIIIKDIKGNDAGGWIGGCGGCVGAIVVSSVKGRDAGALIRTGTGKTEVVIVSDIEGDSAGWCIGSNQGNAKTVIINSVKGNYAGQLIGSFGGNVKQLIYDNVSNLAKYDIYCGSLISLKNAGAREQKLIELVNRLKGKQDYKQVLENVERIRELGEEMSHLSW